LICGGVAGGGYVCALPGVGWSESVASESMEDLGASDSAEEDTGTRVLQAKDREAGTKSGEARVMGASVMKDVGGKVGARRRRYHPRRGLWIVHTVSEVASSYFL